MARHSAAAVEPARQPAKPMRQPRGGARSCRVRQRPMLLRCDDVSVLPREEYPSATVARNHAYVLLRAPARDSREWRRRVRAGERAPARRAARAALGRQGGNAQAAPVQWVAVVYWRIPHTAAAWRKAAARVRPAAMLLRACVAAAQAAAVRRGQAANPPATPMLSDRCPTRPLDVLNTPPMGRVARKTD